jgi:hypothetical protein
VLTLSKVKAYCEDPTQAEDNFACRGRFLNIDICTEKGQERCIQIGSVANQTSGVVAKESLGTKIKLFVEVFLSYIFFCFSYINVMNNYFFNRQKKDLQLSHEKELLPQTRKFVRS